MSVRPSGFFGKSCRAYSDRDTIFGFIYLGKISKSEKSKIQNVIWYLVIVTTSSFFEEKIKNVLRSIYDPKIRIFHKWVHMHSVKTKMFNFLKTENHDPRQIDVGQTSSTQKPWGPPLPCGCNLVFYLTSIETNFLKYFSIVRSNVLVFLTTFLIFVHNLRKTTTI